VVFLGGTGARWGNAATDWSVVADECTRRSLRMSATSRTLPGSLTESLSVIDVDFIRYMRLKESPMTDAVHLTSSVGG